MKMIVVSRSKNSLRRERRIATKPLKPRNIKASDAIEPPKKKKKTRQSSAKRRLVVIAIDDFHKSGGFGIMKILGKVKRY